MKKKINVKHIISLVCCIIIVIGIIAVKGKNFSANKMADITVQKEEPAEMSEAEPGETAEVFGEKAGSTDKKTKFHNDTMNLGEENEDNGIFFTLKSVKVKKRKDADGKNIYRYTMSCDVESGCKGESISMENFADNFSIEIAGKEKKAVLVSGKKKLTYKETDNIRMVVDNDAAMVKAPDKYRVFYTTEPEVDGKIISLFRTEYVTDK